MPIMSSYKRNETALSEIQPRRIHMGYLNYSIQPGAQAKTAVWQFRKMIDCNHIEALSTFHKLAVEAATDGIVICDARFPHHPIVYASPAFCQLTGYDESELTGCGCNLLQGPETDPVTVQQIRDALANARSFKGEILNYHKNGAPFWNLLRIEPLFDVNGQVKHFVGVQTDITASKQTEVSLHQYEILASLSKDFMSLIDTDYNYLAVNQTYLDEFTKSREQVVNHNITEVHSTTSFEEFTKPSLDRCFTGEIVKNQHWLNFPKRGMRFIESIMIPYRDHNENIIGAAVYARDITERKLSEIALRESEVRYRQLIENSIQGIFIKSVTSPVFANQALVDMFGYDSIEEVLALDPTRTFVAEHDRDRLKQYSEDRLAGKPAPTFYEFDGLHKDGTLIRIQNSVQIINWGGLPAIMASMTDVTEKYHLSQQLAYQAKYDELTGLVNRRKFELHLEQLLRYSRKINKSNVLCYIDLDQFRIVNDTAGHTAGDQMLIQVAGLLKSNIRQSDVLGRLGGDEFGLLLRNCSLETARTIANNLLQELSGFRFTWNDQSFESSASIGIVAVDENVENAGQLMSRADLACYTAKDLGRNRIHIYHLEDDELRRRESEFAHAVDIREALEQGRFRLHHQIIIPLDNKNKKRHGEILLRMLDRDGQMISPAAFIPAAERFGLMNMIDKWVISSVLQNFHYLFDDIQLEKVAINLSGTSLNDPSLLSFVKQQFIETRVAPERVCFEITETAIISNLKQAVGFVTEMKQLGCSFALDDFGSGLSSFGYLKRFPVDYIKIDGSFVRDIVEDETDRAMVAAINQVAQVMGIKTIAEFVENEATVGILKDLSIDYIQGYAVGRPQPLKAIDSPLPGART